MVGGALVRYNYNLNRRARKTKAMFTITGRLLNDVVVQVGGDPKVGTFDGLACTSILFPFIFKL